VDLHIVQVIVGDVLVGERALWWVGCLGVSTGFWSLVGRVDDALVGRHVLGALVGRREIGALVGGPTCNLLCTLVG
jgi:hypothetical protein